MDDLHVGRDGVGVARGDAMELTPEQRAFVATIEADIEGRVNRRLRRRSAIRALGYALFVVVLTFAGYFVLRAEWMQNCRSRREARTGIIDLVHLALQDAQPTNPFVVRLENATQPGHPLGPISC